MYLHQSPAEIPTQALRLAKGVGIQTFLAKSVQVMFLVVPPPMLMGIFHSMDPAVEFLYSLEPQLQRTSTRIGRASADSSRSTLF